MKIVIILLCISIAALLPSNSVSQEWLNFNLNNSKLPSNYIWNFSSDSLGRIWIATSDGICYFDNGKIEIPMHIHNALPTNRTTCINFTNSGKMLIGTYEGFCIYENNNLSCYNTSNSILPRNFVLWVSADDDENIWICTQAGLVRMKNGEMNLYNSSNSPSPADLFTYAYKNKFGQELWIGTLRGAIKIIGEKWVSYNPNNSKLTNYPIWAITSNDKETVFGCNKLVKYKNDSWEEVPDDSLGLGNTNIRGLVYDLKGNLYVSSWGGGLSIYNGSFWKYLNTSNSRLITNDLSRIFVDDFNNKWIGSNEHGVFIYNEDGITLSSVVNDNESRKLDIINIPNVVSSSILMIQFYNSVSNEVFINIYDILGRKLYNASLGHYQLGSHNTLVNFDIKNSGSYILELYNGHNKARKLFFVTN